MHEYRSQGKVLIWTELCAKSSGSKGVLEARRGWMMGSSSLDFLGVHGVEDVFLQAFLLTVESGWLAQLSG